MILLNNNKKKRRGDNMKKIIIWNINQRNNYCKTNFIPSLVIDSINGKADIIILTEFYKIKSWETEFAAKLLDYNICTSDNETNQIMIAIKKDMNIIETYTWKSSYDEDKPDYLEVVIEDNEIRIHIIGVRVLVNRYNYNIKEEVNNEMRKRKKQCDCLVDRIHYLVKSDCIIIGGGDFNTGRRDNRNDYWNRNILADTLGSSIKVYTPEGCSHEAYKGKNAGCPDHIIYSVSKRVVINVEPYNWEYVAKDIMKYPDKEYTKNIKPPYPDHAMIKASIELKKSARQKIIERLQKIPDHYLLKEENMEYYNQFLHQIDILEKFGCLDTERKMNSICTKLQILKTFDINKYFQGVSELMLHMYACNNNFKFESDKKLNQKSNGTDVDIQIVYDMYKFNIEVKSPIMNLDDKRRQNLLVDMSYRTIPLEQLNYYKGTVEEEVIDSIVKNSEGEFEDFEYKKIEDTKLLSYMQSCKDKFNFNNDELNILFIALPSDKMQNYWSFLYNPYSGFFTEKFDSFGYFDKDGKQYKQSDFEKIDVIVLSNIISGHLKTITDFPTWDIQKYCNILCINFYGKKFKEGNKQLLDAFIQLFPHDNLRFENHLEMVQKEEMKREMGGPILESIFLSSYLSYYYPHLS